MDWKQREPSPSGGEIAVTLSGSLSGRDGEHLVRMADLLAVDGATTSLVADLADLAVDTESGGLRALYVLDEYLAVRGIRLVLVDPSPALIPRLGLLRALGNCDVLAPVARTGDRG